MQSSQRSYNSKSVLKSLMKEVNMNARLQQELLNYAEVGQSFPYVPKSLIKFDEDVIDIELKRKPQKLPLRSLQRTRNTMDQLGLFQREKFRPNPSKTRPIREKERLQNMMAFGKDIDEEFQATVEAHPREKTDVSAVDLFDEILLEIKERRDFLDEMTKLGLRKKYLPEIQCQISLRLRELEKVDKNRADALLQEYDM